MGDVSDRIFRQRILNKSKLSPSSFRVPSFLCHRIMGPSTTADEFAAELEGALHIKEQEAIIAEVHRLR